MQQTLVITRPIGQSERLLRKLDLIQDKEFKVIHLPLITIEPIDFEYQVEAYFDSIVFISTNAAKYFLDKLIEPEKLSKTQLFSIGNNTANLVNAITGRPVVYPKIMNTEGFLMLKELNVIKEKHWLIIKGKDGRADLQEKLIEKGAKVSTVDVYQRICPSQEVQEKIIQIINHSLQSTLWLITSEFALVQLQNILQNDLKKLLNTQVIISSDRLARIARQKGFKIFAQSKGASEQQLIECLKTLS